MQTEFARLAQIHECGVRDNIYSSELAQREQMAVIIGRAAKPINGLSGSLLLTRK